jgi:FixJ family two-component response regulator
MSVKGMKAGAIDFLKKPIRDQDLIDAVAAAIRVDRDSAERERIRAENRRPLERIGPPIRLDRL